MALSEREVQRKRDKERERTENVQCNEGHVVEI